MTLMLGLHDLSQCTHLWLGMSSIIMVADAGLILQNISHSSLDPERAFLPFVGLFQA